jgi:aspartate aminotransferase
MDLNREQWQQVAHITRDRGFMPVIDMAYQGFGEGLDEDAFGLRLMADSVDEMIICSSCSKNFGLYRERIGACSIIGSSPAAADIINSVLLSVARVNYSMPPEHGAAIVETILISSELELQWVTELATMRNRLANNRIALVTSLNAAKVNRDFNFISAEKGMFSFLSISPSQVDRLRDEYSIYMAGSSRVNIAGIASHNVDYVANAIFEVVK